MKSQLLDFSDKVVLVTGGSTGIGRATALAFARQGAKLVVADMNEVAAQETVDIAKKGGAQAIFVKTDISKSSDVKNMIQTTLSTFGKLDCAFNNAGIAHKPQPISELDEDTFDKVIAIDMKGAFLCMKYELQAMQKSGSGVIVNTSSVGGLLPEPGCAAYIGAKHGVIGLTKTAALENAHVGIRVNAVAPGWVRTPMTQSWDDNKDLNAKLAAATPMHRGAEPEEIAGMVLFLCSDLASYITGQTYAVDGAQTIRGLFPIP